MRQKDYVIKAMENNGGFATIQQLYQFVDFSTWGTKTPQASVRRIVQENNEFFRIEVGLWGLTKYKAEILRRLNISESKQESQTAFTHAYFQGIITEIGNLKRYNTYVPPQDKNKIFLDKKLSDIATVTTIYDFTYDSILKRAKTVDVIWFNNRNMPNAFYEVEHTTDIRNSLNKFYELQDFRAKFYIIAPKSRERQFEDIISSSIYSDIKDIVKFVSYDALIKQYEKESIYLSETI